MIKITNKDIEHLAKLAGLEISSKEKGIYKKQLSEIVEYVGKLQKVNTKNIEPTSQTTGLKNLYRKDEVKSENCLSDKQALSGTDNIHNNLFKTKAILEK